MTPQPRQTVPRRLVLEILDEGISKLKSEERRASPELRPALREERFALANLRARIAIKHDLSRRDILRKIGATRRDALFAEAVRALNNARKIIESESFAQNGRMQDDIGNVEEELR